MSQLPAAVSRTSAGWSIGNLPIRIRVMGSTLVVLLLLTILFASYFPARQQRSSENELRERTSQMAEMLATGVGVGRNLFAFGGVDALKAKLDILKQHCDTLGRNYDDITKTALSMAIVPAPMSAESVVAQCRQLQILAFKKLHLCCPTYKH